MGVAQFIFVQKENKIVKGFVYSTVQWAECIWHTEVSLSRVSWRCLSSTVCFQWHCFSSFSARHRKIWSAKTIFTWMNFILCTWCWCSHVGTLCWSSSLSPPIQTSTCTVITGFLLMQSTSIHWWRLCSQGKLYTVTSDKNKGKESNVKMRKLTLHWHVITGGV